MNNKTYLAQFSLKKNLAEHVSTKRDKNSNLTGGPPEQNNFLENQTKWRLFLYFFAFWQGSLDPQKYELAP